MTAGIRRPTHQPSATSRRATLNISAGVQARIETYLQEKSRLLFGPADEVGSNGNAEALHQMRVASRRVRVGLKFFNALFPEGELRQVQRQLRRVTRTLGDIRTQDVNIQLLRKAVRRLPATHQPAGELLLHTALAERAARQTDLHELMRLFALSKFAARVRALITFRARHRDANRLLAESNEQLRELRRAMRRRHKQFLRKHSSLSFHKFRIAAKRYRYALEACQAVFRIDVQDRIRSVEMLQDRMGEAHDVELLIDYLRQSRGRADKQDKKLAACVERLINSFTCEYQKRFAMFEDYLEEKRPWMKKVRLQISGT